MCGEPKTTCLTKKQGPASHCQVSIARSFGHAASNLTPMEPDTDASDLWQRYCREVEQLVKDVPPYLSPTVGKHYFTATSEMLMTTIYSAAWRSISAGAAGDCPQEQLAVRTCDIARLPAWLWLHVYGLMVIRNEMALPLERRADPPVELEVGPDTRGPRNSLKPASQTWLVDTSQEEVIPY